MTQRAIEEMKKTPCAAQKLGTTIVNDFTGSSTWHLIYDFPPTPRAHRALAARRLVEVGVGQNCLVARRLVEAGVEFVTVPTA